ncbi:MAG: hypothetical protein HQL67_08360 [Magnetococcales bacterium]|nr:hypothetical protein [Magnetococcales bacterium]
MTTQREIAKHLDLSERHVRDLLKELGLPAKNADIDQVRIAYIRHIRAVASRHKSESGLDLVQERARLTIAQREKTEIEVARLRDELISVAEVKAAAFNAGRTVRVAWENWANHSTGPLAAELGTDVVKTRIALEKLVRDHLMRLSEGGKG